MNGSKKLESLRARYWAAVAFLAGGLLAWSAYRATVLSLAHDEARSFLRFGSAGPKAIFDPDRYDASNHVLYSLLSWLCTSAFGSGELAIRLPSVVAGMFLVFAAARFFQVLAGYSALAFAGVLALVLVPLVMDFSVAARGYGLALALSLWAWARMAESPGVPRRRVLLELGIVQGLAVGANLGFVFPNLAFSIVFVGLLLARGQLSRALVGELVLVYALPAILVASMLSLPILAKHQTGYYYVGAGSLLGAVESVVAYAGLDPSGNLATLAAVATCLAVCAALGVASYRIFTGAVPQGGPGPLVVLAAIVLVGMLIASRYLASVPYPADRTAIYLVPLAIALVLIAARETRLLAPAATLALLAIAAASATQLQARYLALWRYDAGTEKVFSIVRARAIESPALDLGHWGNFEPALNYYNRQAGSPFPRFGRAGAEGSHDLYYLDVDSYRALPSGRFRLIYRNAASGSVLLEPLHPS